MLAPERALCLTHEVTRRRKVSGMCLKGVWGEGG